MIFIRSLEVKGSMAKVSDPPMPPHPWSSGARTCTPLPQEVHLCSIQPLVLWAGTQSSWFQYDHCLTEWEAQGLEVQGPSREGGLQSYGTGLRMGAGCWVPEQVASSAGVAHWLPLFLSVCSCNTGPAMPPVQRIWRMFPPV